jgi:hypothetical protein
MVERFKPFLRHLLSLSLSRKTLHKHRDNLRISDVPDAKAQKNFTDPESRIMKSKDGFIQAYNAQIAVDTDAQIIVAQYVTCSGSDSGQLVPLIDAVEANLGRKPREVSADNGYCSDGNLAALEERGIDGYLATGRARDAAAGKGKAQAKAADAGEPAETPVHIDPTQAQENTVDCTQLTTDVELSAGSQSNDRAVDIRPDKLPLPAMVRLPPLKHRRASRPCARRSRPVAIKAPTGCANRLSSRYSGRSKRPAGSASFSCAASRT